MRGFTLPPAHHRPYVTLLFCLALCLSFLVELQVDKTHGIHPPSSPDAPYGEIGDATLIDLGGLRGDHLTSPAELYRILTYTCLHANVAHLAFNLMALLYAGSLAERIFGRPLYSCILCVSAVTAAQCSMAFHDTDVVSVGASGSIMGVLAAELAICLRYSRAVFQKQLARSTGWILLVNLLPIGGRSENIDFAAHFGGAIGGALTALVIFVLWRRGAPPPLRRTAMALNGAALIVLLLGAYDIRLKVIGSRDAELGASSKLPPVAMKLKPATEDRRKRGGL